MTSFEITYSIRGCTSFVPLTEMVLGADEGGARNMFQLAYPEAEIITAEPAGLFAINGRYSRFFKNDIYLNTDYA